VEILTKDYTLSEKLKVPAVTLTNKRRNVQVTSRPLSLKLCCLKASLCSLFHVSAYLVWEVCKVKATC